MEISYLADRPEFIETLAPWVFEHWRPILTQETLETRVAKFQAHLNRDVPPVAWVAHSKSQVFGTAALRVHDLPGREDLTPWLGGVYVAPPFRGRGIGAALCAAVEQKAQDIVATPMLYLFTLDKQAWYRNLGWGVLEPCSWCGCAGDIMFKKIRPAARNNGVGVINSGLSVLRSGHESRRDAEVGLANLKALASSDGRIGDVRRLRSCSVGDSGKFSTTPR